MKQVLCRYWEECGVSRGGCCSEGVYRRPSFGICNTICKSNTSKEGFIPVEEAKKLSLPKRILGKVKSYIEAEASLANEGALDDAQFGARMKLCLVCDELNLSYDDVGHCGACGCGGGRRAALTVKGRMPRATCPKNKWVTVHIKEDENG